MRYVAAYMLANLGGNKAPKEEDIKKILESAGVEYNKESASKVVSEISGADLEELIKKGSERLATVGGRGAAPAAQAAQQAPAAAAESKPEEKEEEEEDEDMGFSLFD